MRSFCKRLLASLAALLLSVTLAIPAAAVECTFSDVSPDSPWYESVEYLADRCITVGNSSGLYRPDDPITVRQWAVMICRAFDRTEALKADAEEFGTACLKESFRNGWISMEGLMAPDTVMYRGALYQNAFNVAGVTVFDYDLYPEGETLDPDENCLRVARELGLYTGEGTVVEIVTRGEAAALLHAVLTRDLKVEDPPMMTQLPIVNEAGVNMNSFLRELRRIPEPIMQEFQRLGWTYMVEFEHLAELGELYKTSCVGATNYSEKRIYVAEADSTAHEFGHFLDGYLGFPSEHTSYYKNEAKAASAFLREYALTSSAEYYADYFAYWLRCHSDANRAEQMQRLTPQTFAYFNSLEASNWGVRSAD